MAITNPIAAAVSNLTFWVPKNDVRNEKLMKEVGLAHITSSVDHCCGSKGLYTLSVADGRQKIPVQASMLCRGPAACKAASAMYLPGVLAGPAAG